MANPGRAFTDPMAWWGVISAAQREHLTTAETFERIRDEAERQGWTLPPGGAVAFNEVRAAASDLAYSAERLARAPESSAILGEHIGGLPYGGGLTGPAAQRLFDVRVGYTAVRSGQVEAGYVTLRYTGGLPATVGELRAEAEDIATSLVEGYGAAITGIDEIQVGEL